MQVLQATLILILVCLGTNSYPFSTEWYRFTSYVKEYGKPYHNDSKLMVEKFDVFKKSLARHQQLNLIESQRGGTATYGVNKFSDLTQEEFKSMYLSSPRLPSVPERTDNPTLFSLLKDEAPTRFDWRNKSVITSVNNQKSCGSCWAFSVIETIESALSIETGTKPRKLSVQQLISCETGSGLNGCQGGEILDAFDRIINTTVIVPESVYPFSSSDGSSGKCKSNLPRSGAMLQEYTKIYNKANDENDMVRLVSQVSPTSNAVNALMWQDYNGGIIQHHCDSKHIDHAVQVVGYDLSNNPIPYWIVRNTWGSDWGEHGYLRLLLGSNTCGIANEVAAVNKVKSY